MRDVSVWMSLVSFGPADFGYSGHFGSLRVTSAHMHSLRLTSAHFGSLWLTSARLAIVFHCERDRAGGLVTKLSKAGADGASG